MKTLFLIDPAFFDGHLNGARIPLCLMMLDTLRDGGRVCAQIGPRRVRVSFPSEADTIDASFSGVRLEDAPEECAFDLAVCQKGVPPELPEGVEVTQVALMLNDARGRQAINQFNELLSGRFGFDLFRMLGPLRAIQGNRRDRAQMARFDRVYVQTAPEAAYLRKRFSEAEQKVRIFNNGTVTLRLFEDTVVARPKTPRPRRFLLPVPPASRRVAEYEWFLKRLAAYPKLLEQTTVLLPSAFAGRVPEGFNVASAVPDFQAFLTSFDCVLVPTGHYTGLNNRVLQAALAGCDVIASPQALEGLIPHEQELAAAPHTFAQFRALMETWPEGGTALRSGPRRRT
ncbi:hypothetical protein [Marinovum sp. B10]|uniref:hypothetical protein n=1 Tax=Marinovum sp. B10 TaxID=3449224 RepID=UPI003EDC8B17